MHQLKTEQEGLKRKLKEKKDTLDKSKVIGDFESSSSSSSSFESSDSERKEESNKNWFRSRAMTHSQEAAASANSVMQRENSGSSDGELSCSNGCKDDEIETIVEGPTTKTIEVCMGGKDRKLGGAESENLERKLGADVDVVGCKCLGRCNNGPNVRTFNYEGSSGDSTGQPNNPSITGVGMDDVDLDFKNLLGRDIND
ncbi:hypothetical protein SLE2022_330870 [Rubroshorea leprosula]